MSRRKTWLQVLTVILLLMAVAELFRAEFLLSAMFACFAASAAIISVNVPKYQNQTVARLGNFAYLALASGLVLYIFHFFIHLKQST